MDNMGNDLNNQNESPQKRLYYKNILDVPLEDQKRVRIWRNSPHVNQMMLNQNYVSEEQHEKWLHFLVDNPKSHIVRVAYYGQHHPIGIIVLKDVDLHSSISNWGFYIGERSFLGIGLGKQMLLDIFQWAFGQLSIYKLYTSVLGNNDKALKMYLKAGFCLEGTWKQHLLNNNGTRVDLLWIAMFQDQWKRGCIQGEINGFNDNYSF